MWFFIVRSWGLVGNAMMNLGGRWRLKARMVGYWEKGL
jgi:hypothetical protein